MSVKHESIIEKIKQQKLPGIQLREEDSPKTARLGKQKESTKSKIFDPHKELKKLKNI